MIGLLISLPVVVFGATLVSQLLERFPALVYVGAGILLYAAGELIVSEAFWSETWIGLHNTLVVATLTCGVLGLGYWQNARSGPELTASTADE